MIVFNSSPRAYLIANLLGIPILIIFFKYGVPILEPLGITGTLLALAMGIGVGALSLLAGRAIDAWIETGKRK